MTRPARWLSGPWHMYDDDRKVLAELGKTHKVISETFKDLTHMEWTKVAVIWLTYGDEKPHDAAARIELSICAMPAVAYKAEIFKAPEGDGATCVVTTGTGWLGQFMPMFIAIAEGMLVIKPGKDGE